MHLEISDPREVGGKKVKQKFKGWPRVRVAQFQPNIVTTPNMDNAREEAACNENPHVFFPSSRSSFRGHVASDATGLAALQLRCQIFGTWYFRGGLSEHGVH